mgnify:CR=1 FL=1
MKQLRILLGIALIFLLLSGCTRNHRASTDDRAATSGEETVAGEETTEPTLEPNELSGEDFCFASEIPGLNTLLRIRKIVAWPCFVRAMGPDRYFFMI